MSDTAASPLIVAVCGSMGSGKDTVAQYLEDRYGFLHITASDMLREEAIKDGEYEPISRVRLGEIGDKLEQSEGDGPITRRALAHYTEAAGQHPGGLALGGIRRMPEIEYIQANGGFVVFVDAKDEIRYSRIAARGRADDQIKLEELRARESVEQAGSDAKSRQFGIWIQGAKKKADFIVDNSGTLDELHAQVDGIMNKIGKQEAVAV